jgi:hypothetical protein
MFQKQFRFVAPSLKIRGYGNTDNKSGVRKLPTALYMQGDCSTLNETVRLESDWPRCSMPGRSAVFLVVVAAFRRIVGPKAKPTHNASAMFANNRQVSTMVQQKRHVSQRRNRDGGPRASERQK